MSWPLDELKDEFDQLEKLNYKLGELDKLKNELMDKFDELEELKDEFDELDKLK